MLLETVKMLLESLRVLIEDIRIFVEAVCAGTSVSSSILPGFGQICTETSSM
jgi:hypothetical protein